MTPKERIRATIEHKQTDRVASTMQCVETQWDKLKEYFKVESEDEVMDILEIDTRIMDMPPYIGPEHPTYINEDGEEVITHEMGFGYVKKWNGVEYNQHIVELPYNQIETWEDFEKFDGWLNPDHYDYSAVKEFCDKHEDKAIRIGWPGPYQVFTLMYDAEKFYINMYENPDLLKAMLKRYCDSSLELYRRMFEAAEGRIDILRCCDDYGTQISLLFSPQMWDEYFAENTKRFVDLAHQYGAYYLQHSCGAIRPIIPNLVRLGVDVIEPLQKVEGMEVDGLKADFGKDVCFQGGVDTQGVLPLGTPEEVYAETKRIITALNPGGGYILAPSQDFEGDVPVENVVALYEARKEFGGF